MRKRVSIWNPWILIPAGVIVLVIGLVVYLQTLSRKKRFIGEATAEILSVKHGAHHVNGRTQHVYTPIVAYTIDGTRYEAKGQGNGRSDYYVQGAQIPIRYNPDKPDKCLTIPSKESERGALITLGIGAVLALLGVIAMLTT